MGGTGEEQDSVEVSDDTTGMAMAQRTFIPLVLTTVLSVVGGLGVALAPPAAAGLHVEQYVEVPQCQPATGQDCPQMPQVKFTGDEKIIQLQYTSNANGCSDALFRFNVDRYPQTDWIRDSPGQTITVNVGTHPGEHVVSVAARGVEGGCNTGVLIAWGGTVRLDTADDVGPAPVKTPCRWSLDTGGNILRGRDLRFTFESWQGNAPAGPFRMYAPNSTVLLDHGDILYSTPKGNDDVDFGIVWRDERNNYWRNDEYKGTFDPSNGTLRGTVDGSDGSSTDWNVTEFFTCK
jgi:hypothetical protein